MSTASNTDSSTDSDSDPDTDSSQLSLAVVGSRGFLKGALFSDDLRTAAVDATIARECPFPPEDVNQMISGGASGADTAGEAWGEATDGVDVVVHEAEWEAIEGKPDSEIGTRRDGSQYWKRAGFVRNQRIVDDADHILAFWNGNSRGTQDTIKKAFAADVRVTVVRYDKLDRETLLARPDGE